MEESRVSVPILQVPMNTARRSCHLTPSLCFSLSLFPLCVPPLFFLASLQAPTECAASWSTFSIFCAVGTFSKNIRPLFFQRAPIAQIRDTKTIWSLAIALFGRLRHRPGEWITVWNENGCLKFVSLSRTHFQTFLSLLPWLSWRDHKDPFGTILMKTTSL